MKTLNPKLSTLSPIWTLNPKPQTLNPKPYTLNPTKKPSRTTGPQRRYPAIGPGARPSTALRCTSEGVDKTAISICIWSYLHYVCVYIYTYICISRCICIYIYVYVRVHRDKYIHQNMYICIYICTCVHVDDRLNMYAMQHSYNSDFIWRWLSISISICICICICMYVD